MANNTDHQSKASEQTTETPPPVNPFCLKTHVQKLTEGWEQLQVQVEQSKAHQAEAQARIQELESQLKESEGLRALSEDKIRDLQAKLRLFEGLKTQSAGRILELQGANEASEKKVQELEAQLKESEGLRIQAQNQVQALQRSLEDQKIQVQAHQRELKSRDSQLERFKAQVQGKLEELETFKSKALATEQARAAEQLSNMKAHYQAQRNDFHAKWEARYYKDIDALKAKLAQAQEPKPQSLGPEIIRLNQLVESQEAQFTAIKDGLQRRLRAKENVIVALHGALKNEQEKLQILEFQRRQEVETLTELNDKAVLQVEIQLGKSQEEVRELRETTLRHVQVQLEKSRAETRQVWDIVREMEGKLGEAEARLTLAEAPKRRGRPPKVETQAKTKSTKKK
ncbi:hypothetical protein CAEBREN_08218 [Caenorhabditis brenneri]|uniref:Uncharacterized protein n=1 Tax=Caenorhabditis brenneri TaxID=135651 RepID=G0N258_CAEBE|nr:hypothetical protein CAEBREN_08218 [Caenorhabditis brenneri]